MPKPPKGPRLGTGPSHERLMLAGLAADLFRHERIRTTVAKAKRLRAVAERLITLGKAGTIHARRQALAVVEDRDIVHKLFSDIAPRYSDRSGGYTRVLRLGPRKGDSAPMALIELIEVEERAAAPASKEEAPRRRRGLRRRGRREEGEVAQEVTEGELPEVEAGARVTEPGGPEPEAEAEAQAAEPQTDEQAAEPEPEAEAEAQAAEPEAETEAEEEPLPPDEESKG